MNKLTMIVAILILLAVFTACQPIVIPDTPAFSGAAQPPATMNESPAESTPDADISNPPPQQSQNSINNDDSAAPMSGPNESNLSPQPSESFGPNYEMTEDNIAIDTLIRTFTGYAVNKDVMSMLNMFAVDEYISGYNTALLAEESGLSPDDERIQPPTSVERITDVDSDISRYFYGFFMDDLNVETMTQADFLNAFGALDCTSLSVLRIDKPAMSVEDQKENESVNQNMANRYGAEAADFRTMLLNLDGKTYYCGATFVKYDGIWKFLYLTCNAVQLDRNIITGPMTISEYEELLKQWLNTST